MEVENPHTSYKRALIDSVNSLPYEYLAIVGKLAVSGHDYMLYDSENSTIKILFI
jgi:hypothetical protein